MHGQTDTQNQDCQPYYVLFLCHQGRHSENSPGEWIWDSNNSTVEWFDWADGEPNNYDNSGEMCLSMMEIHDPFFPIFRDYFWNDLSCDAAAHYICQNTCFQ